MHRFPNNYTLSYSVLKFTLKKYQNQPDKLNQYDAAIKQELKQGIIKNVSPDSIEDDPNVSFLAHNAVFRESLVSTKCRVVFLSNLCDKRNASNLCHNQISFPGVQLNNKIQTIVTQCRFNTFLFLHDFERAIVQLYPRPDDSLKMHFLWFRDLANNDKIVVKNRFKRVPFGLRFSPYLLIMSLFIILVICLTIGHPRELNA